MTAIVVNLRTNWERQVESGLLGRSSSVVQVLTCPGVHGPFTGMDACNLKSVLTELRFTSPLSAKVLEHVIGCSAESEYRAGQIIFREGEENQQLYLLASGSVALDMNVPARGPVRILSLGPGDMLGWSALLGEGQMTSTATALEDTHLIAISAECLRNVCETDHEVGYALMRQMALALSRRLVATRLQLLDLFSDTSASVGGPRHG